MRPKRWFVRPGMWVVAGLIVGAAAIYRLTHGSANEPSEQVPSHTSTDRWTGATAPGFALRTLDGRFVRLADFRGKVVLLNFWATWCAPCRFEMPWLVDFNTRYRSQGLEIIGISVDDGGAAKIRQFLRDMKVNYTVVRQDDRVSDAYGGVRFLPQTFFVGRDGRVMSRSYGVRGKDAFEADVRRALVDRLR